MGIPYTDLHNFVFDIFGNSRRQLNLAVAFRFKDGKYQNILLTPIFANSPRCLRHCTKNEVFH